MISSGFLGGFTLPFVVAGGIAACLGFRAAEEPLARFSITVTAAGEGIAATCNEGCAWKDLTASYEGGEYHVTEVGISRQPPEQPGFWFTLTTGRSGISATCKRGCAWTSASARYSTTHFTDRGVEPAPSTR